MTTEKKTAEQRIIENIKWPAIASEQALSEAIKRVKPLSVDGKSEFALAWRLCLEFTEKYYDLTPKSSILNAKEPEL